MGWFSFKLWWLVVEGDGWSLMTSSKVGGSGYSSGNGWWGWFRVFYLF